MKDECDFSEATRGALYRKDAVLQLPEAIAEAKREARANGLTGDAIDAELRARQAEPIDIVPRNHSQSDHE